MARQFSCRECRGSRVRVRSFAILFLNEKCSTKVRPRNGTSQDEAAPIFSAKKTKPAVGLALGARRNCGGDRGICLGSRVGGLLCRL